MNQVSESVTLSIGDAHLTIPKESLVLAWLNQIGTRRTAPISPVPRIGEEWDGQGGIYAGIIRGEKGRPDRYLIAPTNPDAAVIDIKWGHDSGLQTEALSEYDGRANTIALVNAGAHHAAEWAFGLDIGPHSDFYLPARRELSLLYANVPELFPKDWHWSSTQYAPHPSNAWFQVFDSGNQYDYPKSYAGRARAVRSIPIQ